MPGVPPLGLNIDRCITIGHANNLPLKISFNVLQYFVVLTKSRAVSFEYV